MIVLVLKAGDASEQTVGESSKTEITVEFVGKLPVGVPAWSPDGQVVFSVVDLGAVALPLEDLRAAESIHLPGYSSSDLSPPAERAPPV